MAAAMSVSKCSGRRDIAKFTDTGVLVQVKPETVSECAEELAGASFPHPGDVPFTLLEPVFVRRQCDSAKCMQRTSDVQRHPSGAVA